MVISPEPSSPPKVPDAKYKITEVSLEYEIVPQPDLADSIAMEYQSMALPYDRILKNRQIPVNKMDSWFINTPCRSLKGILVQFKSEELYKRDRSRFYSSKIKKVAVIVEGKPNQLYTEGMRSFEQYDETCKYFAEGKQRDASANEVQKHLKLHDLSTGEYLTDKYALQIDFRTIDENTGRGIGSEEGGITLQTEKKA